MADLRGEASLQERESSARISRLQQREAQLAAAAEALQGEVHELSSTREGAGRQTREALDEARPDYVFILPWNLRKEIANQLAHARDWGAKFVVPIPRLEVFD